MVSRSILVALLLAIVATRAQGESRIIGVAVSADRDSKPSVSIWSAEKKEMRRSASVAEASEVLRKAEDWGSVISVGVVVRGRFRPAEYLPILKAIAENPMMELTFVDIELGDPDWLKENIRERLKSLVEPTP